MQIFGNQFDTYLTHVKEKGSFFGYNDTLKAPETSVTNTVYGVFANGILHAIFTGFSDSQRHEVYKFAPTIYLHIPTNRWSHFTGKVREYLLPWRWKVAYIDKGTELKRILICTKEKLSDISLRLSEVTGKSPFAAHLIARDQYEEIFEHEYICIRNAIKTQDTILSRYPCLPIIIDSRTIFDDTSVRCHIYRRQDLLSTLGYYFRRTFSSTWCEVGTLTYQISENILIRKDDRETLKKAGPIGIPNL